MGRVVIGVIALLVGSYVGWKTDELLDALARDLERDKARDRHLAAETLCNEIEARWGPPQRWMTADPFPADKEP